MAVALFTAAFTSFSARSQVNTQYFLSNDAAGSFVDGWSWSVTQGVTTPSTVYVPSGTPVTFGFQVGVSHSPLPAPKHLRVRGNILVENFGNPAAILDLTDRLLAPLPVTCDVRDAFGAPASGIIVPVFFFETFTYECVLPDGPVPASPGLNESTGAFTLLEEPGGTQSASALVSFDWAALGEADACVSVQESPAAGMSLTYGSPPLPDNELCVGENGTYAFTGTVLAVPGCVEYSSSVLVTAVDTLASSTATTKVRACGTTGALGPGYWQNKNGQARIAKGALEADGATCKSHTYLSALAPFHDLVALHSKSCPNVAAWVAGVMRAASARGPTMNAMLKAQMLATALGVFFSDASLGELDVDLTKVCTQPAACASPTDPAPNGFVSSVSAFGGALHMKVKDLLSYAASRYLAHSWYEDLKALQELAKDTFAAINGEKAFAWTGS